MKKKIVGLCLAVFCVLLMPFNLSGCKKDKGDLYLTKTVHKQYKNYVSEEDDSENYYYEKVEEYRSDKQLLRRKIASSSLNMDVSCNYDDSGLIDTLEAYTENAEPVKLDFSYSLVDGKRVGKASYYDFDNSDNYEIEYTYSKENQLLKWEVSNNNEIVSYKIFDDKGNTVEHLSINIKITTVYDDDGRVLSNTTTTNGFFTDKFEYEYDGKFLKKETYTNTQETSVTNYRYEEISENTVKFVSDDNTDYSISKFDDYGNEIENKTYDKDGILLYETINTYCE